MAGAGRFGLLTTRPTIIKLFMQWHYANGGNRVGPVTPGAFETLVADGVVKGDTLVWTKGMAEWLPWSQIGPTSATCAASGGRYLQRDMVPYEGKFISNEHKELYFQRLQEGVAAAGQMVYGNFGTRFAAKLIDGVINWVVNTAINLGLVALFFGSFRVQPQADPHALGKFMAFQGTTFLCSQAFSLTYYWFFLSRFAATPGKLALGLKVVRSDGSRLTNGRIVARYFSEILSALILAIGYLMAAFDEERRTLHDRICDTRVIKSR